MGQGPKRLHGLLAWLRSHPTEQAGGLSRLGGWGGRHLRGNAVPGQNGGESRVEDSVDAAGISPTAGPSDSPLRVREARSLTKIGLKLGVGEGQRRVLILSLSLSFFSLTSECP